MRFRGRVLTTANSFPVPVATVSADSILLQGLPRLFMLRHKAAKEGARTGLF